jgi:two-component system NtrC family sensor kinase
MAVAHILFVLSETETGLFLEQTVLAPAEHRITTAADWSTAETILQTQFPDVIVVGEEVGGESAFEQLPRLLKHHPFVPVFLVSQPGSTLDPLDALRAGFFDCWKLPVKEEEALRGIEAALNRRQEWLDHTKWMVRRDTQSIELRTRVLESLERVGRNVTSMLDLDQVLNGVVDAAVELTGAEEGSLLLLDDATGEFYMRASRNFQEEFARSFRIPVKDSMLAEVVRTGQPMVIDGKTPQKIKTSFLVHTLIYMPLRSKDRVVGALEVDHRQLGQSFSEEHVRLMSTLADYAVIAIQNASLYERTESERRKLEAILTGIEEAVIIIDADNRLMMVNQKARETFEIRENNVVGRRVKEVLSHPELLDLIGEASPDGPTRVEITLDDGRVLNAQVTSLAGIGLVISMQDITHLKELDRIKSDFVHTVSHDLRSPLTAILGYVELIDRVGPVNEQQRDFIHRVQISVQNITALINDLLDLGRIEAGFDARKEIVPISPILHYAVDGLVNRFQEKQQELSINIPNDLPQVLGNPVRLRQMLNNLIVNANKYAPPGGRVWIAGRAEGGQVIVQVSDNGPGIPPGDQPYIFDKFYRASNVPPDTPGTGLGLAIVKSIVENHLGRVWVDSALGKGTTFTVVLPTAD